MKRLALTGFGPFPGIPKNPSAALVRRLARDRRLVRAEIAVFARLIPTEYAAVDAAIPRLIADIAPDAVLMFGVAGKRRHLSVEARALNRVSILAPDAAGRHPAKLTLSPGAPFVLGSRARVAPMVRAASAASVKTRRSISAGTYLCNFAYWRMLAALPPTVPCLFVHIPKVRGSAQALRIADAAVAIARLLCRRK